MTEVHNLPPIPEPDPPDTGDGLASLIASRICHDIVSPLGAIANGVELLLLSGTERTPELDLIAQSVEGATARIRFFRLAYGAPKGRVVAHREVAEILRGLERTSRFTYHWTCPTEHPRDEVRAVFLLMQCLETALPQGGRLRISREGPTWHLEAEGPRLRFLPLVWDALGPRRAAPPDTAALVQFAVLPGVLVELGRALVVNVDDDRMTARF